MCNTAVGGAGIPHEHVEPRFPPSPFSGEHGYHQLRQCVLLEAGGTNASFALQLRRDAVVLLKTPADGARRATSSHE